MTWGIADYLREAGAHQIADRMDARRIAQRQALEVQLLEADRAWVRVAMVGGRAAARVWEVIGHRLGTAELLAYAGGVATSLLRAELEAGRLPRGLERIELHLGAAPDGEGLLLATRGIPHPWQTEALIAGWQVVARRIGRPSPR